MLATIIRRLLQTIVVMLVMFPPSQDTAEMIHRVGQITGAIGGAGVALMLVGLIGKTATSS